jgi:hypothetical protein
MMMAQGFCRHLLSTSNEGKGLEYKCATSLSLFLLVLNPLGFSGLTDSALSLMGSCVESMFSESPSTSFLPLSPTSQATTCVHCLPSHPRARF